MIFNAYQCNPEITSYKIFCFLQADKVMSIIGSSGSGGGGAAGKARSDNMGSEGSRACSIM